MVAREQARAATIMFFRISFFLWSRASKRAQRPLCFCAVFSYSFFYYGRARASARSDHYVFALFFRIPFFFIFFIFFFFFLFSLSRNL
jgi:hypothetical protein